MRHIPTSSAKNEDHCSLFCFDKIPNKEACQLLPFGHLTCVTCSEANLKSAANSGQGGGIQCASHKCRVSVGIYNSVHILFKDGNTGGNAFAKNHACFQHLVQFAMERSTPHNTARFCLSRNGGRILVKTAKSLVPDTPGFNTLLCDFGTCLCADWETSGPAHPGVSCSAFAMIRATMESGKVDNELEQ
jgi:hypothetical protein